jgi:uncharacterized protein YggU (UPF0235/DUF167 family)
MEIRVKVTPNARRESLEEGKDGRLIITLREPREEGRANVRLVALIAQHFLVPENRVRIVRGHQQSSKIVAILEHRS